MLSENEQLKSKYIGGVYIEDVYAFCDMKVNPLVSPDAPYEKQETGIVVKLRKHAKTIGEDWIPTFYWPAAIFGPLWYAYRGMIKLAVILELVACIVALLLSFAGVGEIGTNILTIIICGVINGFMAAGKYYNHMRRRVELRGAFNRIAIPCEELKKSLHEEGRRSTCIKRVAVYIILRYMVYAILESILFSIVIPSL